MLNNVSIQTRPCNLSCMHMQHLFLLFNASFSSNCKWKSLLYFFNFESYWSCNIKVWRWKNFEMIVFQKDKKIPSFSKSKLLLSINNQNINLTKWNQSILVAVLIILGFRHQNIETWSDYHSNRTTSGLARKWNGYDIRKKISVVLKIE